jgi:hypothetical protein
MYQQSDEFRKKKKRYKYFGGEIYHKNTSKLTLIAIISFEQLSSKTILLCC